MLQMGEPPPDVPLLDDAGLPFRSSDLLGSWFAMYWYPRADTPGCRAQAEAPSLKARIKSFDELGCRILGFSFDPPEVNARFRFDYRFPLPLLTDEGHRLASAVGALSAGCNTPRRFALVVDRRDRPSV